MPQQRQQQVVSFDIGTRNLAFCVVHVPCSAQPRVVAWEKHDIKGGSDKHTTDNLLRLLDHVANDVMADEPTIVLVENQPSRACRIMKVVQLYVVAYFDVVAFYTGRDVVTRCVSPKGKLRTADAPARALRGTRNARYRSNKATAVTAVAGLLDGDRVDVPDALKRAFRCCKKNDDYADCLLQALFFLGF